MLCKAELSLHKNDKSRCYHLDKDSISNTKPQLKTSKNLEASSLKIVRFQPVFLQGQQNNCYSCALGKGEGALVSDMDNYITLTSETGS